MPNIIEHADKNGDFVTGDDGFVVFWPSASGGALTAENLHQLADELDRRNADWQKQLNEYMDER